MKPLDIKESEKATERFLENECLKIGGLALKWISSNKAGVPDRICFFPGKIIKLVEVKSEGLKPSKLQSVTFAVLGKLGFPVAIVDTKAKVLAFIEEVRKEQGERNELRRNS